MKSLKNLKENETIFLSQNMNDIKGGKRVYGLVKLGGSESNKFFGTPSVITNITMVNARTMRLQNAQGDEICVEW